MGNGEREDQNGGGSETDDESGESELTEGEDYVRPDDATDDGDNVANRLGDEAEPLLEGSTVGPGDEAVPTKFLLSAGVFLAIFLVCFFGLWALMGGIGILVGVVVGTALGLVAMKLLADQSRTRSAPE